LDDEIVGISKNSIEGVYLVEERIIILTSISPLSLATQIVMKK
jgi:hypothetical protein